MHETAAERERLLRQIRGGSELWFDSDYILSQWIIQYPGLSNPCTEIVMSPSGLCTLGTNPLVKFTKFNFKF